MTTNDMVIRFRVDGAGKVRQEVNGITQELGKTSGAAANVASAAKSMVAQFIGAAVIYKTIRSVTTAVLEQEKAVTALNASLTNTGTYSAQFSQALQDNASALQKLTIYEDEAILSGTALMQNIGNMSADVLPKAQKAALGLAAAYGMSLETAFQMVGKAAAGNTALLGRYGIVLDESLTQTEKFAKVLEIGAGKFGLAEAAAKTTAGQLEQLKNAVGDMYEIIGAALIPVMQGFVAILKPVVDWISRLTATQRTLLVVLPLTIAAWLKMQKIFTGLIIAQGSIKAAFVSIGIAIKAMTATVSPVTMILTAATAAFTAYTFITNKAKAESSGLATSIASINDEAFQTAARFEYLKTSYKALRQQTLLTSNEKTRLKNIINQLKTEYPTYLKDLDLEAGKLDRITRAFDNQTAAFDDNLRAKIKSAVMEDYVAKMAETMKKIVALEQTGFTIPGTTIRQRDALTNSEIAMYRRSLETLRSQAKITEEQFDSLIDSLDLFGTKNIRVLGDGEDGNGTGAGTGTGTPVDPNISRFQQLRSSYMDRLDFLREVYLAEIEIIKKYGKDKNEIDVLIKSRDKQYKNDQASLQAETLSGAQAVLDRMIKYYDAMEIRSGEYYTALKEAKINEAKLLFPNESELARQEALIKKYTDDIDAERMAFVRGDEILTELKKFGMTQADEYQAQYDEQANRLKAAVENQKLIISQALADGLISPSVVSAMTANLESALSAALANLAAELSKNLESLKEKTQEAAASVNPFESWLETMTPIYDSIETLTANVVNAFGEMITEGKSFGDAMKDAFKSWVGSAISEIARLMARMVALFVMRMAFNALTGGTESLGIGSLFQAALGITAGGKSGLPAMPSNAFQPPLINPMPPVSSDNGLKQLIGEVQGLRRDVYASQPTSLKMDWRKGEISQAVDNDRRYRLVMN